MQLIKRASSTSNIKYQTALVEFNEGKLEKVYKTCQSLDNNLSDKRTDEEKKNWANLKQGVIEAIAKKRETSPNYAPHIILPTLSTVPVTGRAVENPKPPVSSPKDVPNKDFLERCINYIKSGELHRASNLCAKEALQISEDQDGTFLGNIKTLQTCLDYIKSQHFTQAGSYAEEQLRFATNDSLKKEFWKVLSSRVTHMKLLAQLEMDQVLHPKPQVGINWDRFAGAGPGRFYPYINRDTFPELYDIATKRTKAIDSQVKRQLVAFACTTIILTFAIPFALYSKDFISDFEAKLISPFIAAIIILLSCTYCIVSMVFAEERVVAEIRAKNNSMKKEI